jgi:molybdate transport system regulatory protein
MHKAFRIVADIEIQKNGKIFLDKKRIQLLRLVQSSGSILSASKKMNISYQMAWNYIREINNLSPLPVVVRQRGGVNGGGATITNYGQKLIKSFLMMANKHNDYISVLDDDLRSCFF